jgi:RNA polymerase sigma factor (sigma-70 family)
LLRGADDGIAPDRSLQVEQRDELVRLLLRLPPGQRAAIVLRYWEDLSEAQAAEVLGCSASTVRSATSRGLHRLRELSGTMPTVTDQGGRTR